MQAVDMGSVALWGSKADARADELVTLTGERDAALRECAELRVTVAGLEARLATAVGDRQMYYELFVDATNALQARKG